MKEGEIAKEVFRQRKTVSDATQWRTIRPKEPTAEVELRPAGHEARDLRKVLNLLT